MNRYERYEGYNKFAMGLTHTEDALHIHSVRDRHWEAITRELNDSLKYNSGPSLLLNIDNLVPAVNSITLSSGGEWASDCKPYIREGKKGIAAMVRLGDSDSWLWLGECPVLSELVGKINVARETRVEQLQQAAELTKTWSEADIQAMLAAGANPYLWNALQKTFREAEAEAASDGAAEPCPFAEAAAAGGAK